jgi:chromosome partitioning protein
MFDSRTLHAKEVVGELKGRFSDQFPIFNPVRRSVRFAEAPIVGQSVLDYAEETEGATVYLALAKEIYSEEAR